MAAFFSILLALALVAGIVYVLRRYQERAIEEIAERHTPLPPLDPDARTPAVLDKEGLDKEGLDKEALDAEPEAPATANPLSPAAQIPTPNPETVPEPVIEPEPEPAPVSVTDTTFTDSVPASWQERCQQLKSEGKLGDALALARQVYPQWSAFEQQAVILRMQIRDLKRKGGPESDSATGSIDELVSQLYLAAARASCLHDKLDDMPAPPVGRKLAEVIPQSEIQALEMPYEHIGSDKLRLLTKTDRRMLEELWGQPSSHMSARTYHKQYWQQRQAQASTANQA